MNLHPCIALSMPGPGEWVIILLIVLLLFGGKKLPDLARSLGKSMSEFKKGKEEGLQPSEPNQPKEIDSKKS
jgi:sec-independent protein translocase protein TatA